MDKTSEILEYCNKLGNENKDLMQKLMTLTSQSGLALFGIFCYHLTSSGTKARDLKLREFASLLNEVNINV